MAETSRIDPELPTRMLAYATKYNLSPSHPMRLAAASFADAAAGYYAEPPTTSARAMMGAWAHARRVWSDVTGEAMV